MRTIMVQQRRRAMVRRHHLAGDARSPEAATQAVVALHATDPASVYLSVLARSAASTLSDVADAMYARRSLVRWMAMRRTLFVFAREDIALVAAAVSTPLAETLRRALISRLRRTAATGPSTATSAAGSLISRTGSNGRSRGAVAPAERSRPATSRL